MKEVERFKSSNWKQFKEIEKEIGGREGYGVEGYGVEGYGEEGEISNTGIH